MHGTYTNSCLPHEVAAFHKLPLRQLVQLLFIFFSTFSASSQHLPGLYKPLVRELEGHLWCSASGTLNNGSLNARKNVGTGEYIFVFFDKSTCLRSMVEFRVASLLDLLQYLHVLRVKWNWYRKQAAAQQPVKLG